jgi:hypothetical protein
LVRWSDHHYDAVHSGAQDQLQFFINSPMRSAEHLMKDLYADDAFYSQSTARVRLIAALSEHARR